MIADLRPYAEYKDSGIPWLGDVPAHWHSVRAKSLLRRVQRPPQAGNEVVTCFRDGTVTLRRNRRLTGFTEATKYFGYQGIRVGDLVIHMMDAFAGAIGVADSDGMSTPVYIVCEVWPISSAKYLSQLVRQMARSQWILALAKGIRERSTDFRFDTFGAQWLALPPLPEQAAIVRFLDWATRRVDRAIRAKRRLVALLTEQKQAIIHRAVTQGLDPSVPMKESGIPWLGEIPAHWEVVRAKEVYRERDERSVHGGEELLSVSHLTGVTPRSEKSVTMFRASSYAGHKLCRPGDLVVNTMWAWMGALGVSSSEGIISSAYAVYRQGASRTVHGAFIAALLKTVPYLANIVCTSTGLHSSRLRLYPDKFLSLPLAFPSVDEQRQIVEHFESATQDLNYVIERTQRQIGLLREYRARLVADVVTGKLDVRAFAETLPDEAPDDIEATEADVDEDADDDETGDGADEG